MKQARRIVVPVVQPASDANIRRRYAIEQASWIWHPAKAPGQAAALRFANAFSPGAPGQAIIHVSADHRYELSLDGELISLGPDRSDVRHWSFASYALDLSAGRHELEALVWWIGPAAPTAQLSYRGGFILAAEGPLAGVLNTGQGDWQVADLASWTFGYGKGEVGPTMVGLPQTIDGRRPFDLSTPPARQGDAVASPVEPAVVLGPLEDSEWSSARQGWALHPSALPDQLCRVVRPGRIIAVIHGGLDGESPLLEEHLRHADIGRWQLLIEAGQPFVVEPGKTVSVLWDLQDYYCGYSQATLGSTGVWPVRGMGVPPVGLGGTGVSPVLPELSMTWAEALFERPANQWSKHKGDRRLLVGKFFRGPRDSFIHDAPSQRSYRACWWRSGRYILLTVRAGDRPLRVDDVSIRETRYPLENEGRFAAGDPSAEPIIPLAVRGLQMCAHETFMDCPHYEQLQYVGDTRLQMLASYVLTRDDRLCRRAARMFDWSRSLHGLVNSSYPAGPQMISTFPPYWVLMVHDLAFWRDAAEAVRDLMIGVRDALEQYQRLRSPDGLLGYLPGWPFVDTVPEWIDTLYGPDTRKGPSPIVNLLYVYALTKAAELEDVLGEKELAARDGRLAKEISRKVVERFWVSERSLFADDVEHRAFSQHAQCLALLSGVLPARQRRACFEAMLAATDLAQAQPMYWMFYLFEVFHLFGRGDLVLEKLPIWSGLVEAGFKTPPEMFEPSRSDCHGWGGHILFHFHATLAGIRPAAPGFARVEIAPSPGSLRRIESRLPHPRGFIEARMEFSADGRNCRARIVLPKGITGVFRWRGKKHELRPGKQDVRV